METEQPQELQETERWQDEQHDQQRIDALWAEEAERRDRELESGIVAAIPGEDVINRLRSRYKR